MKVGGREREGGGGERERERERERRAPSNTLRSIEREREREREREARTLEFFAIHRVFSFACLVVIQELDEGEWFWPPDTAGVCVKRETEI